MSEQVDKVFEPYKKSKSAYAWSVLGFLLVSLGCFSQPSTPISFDILVFVAGALWFFYSILSSDFERITVTSGMVIRSRLSGRRFIPISDIRIVKMTTYSEENISLVFIETNQEKFYMGDGLTDDQVKEAVAYILEQIRINYPENYHDVRTEHYKVEKFWRK